VKKDLNVVLKSVTGEELKDGPDEFSPELRALIVERATAERASVSEYVARAMANHVGRPELAAVPPKLLTAKSIIVNILSAGTPAEQPPPSGEEKAKRWVLATTLQATAGEQDLTAEEVVMIKKVVGLAYQQPFIVGPIFNLLDPPKEKT
jgi:hypothetical protein